MKGDSLALAQLSAQIQTIGAARAALQVASDNLAIVAQVADLLPVTYAIKDRFAALLASLTGSTGSIVEQLKSEIAQAQGYIAKYNAIYAGATPDLFDEEISTANSMGIASTLAYTNKVLNNAQDWLSDNPQITAMDFVRAEQEVLAAVAQAAGAAASSIVQAAANVAASAVESLWVPLLVVGGGVLLVVAWQKGWLKASA